MPTGMPNSRRPRCASLCRGQGGRDELLEAEIAAYHSPGTCTFYGTANTNQMLMEAMGLHLPAPRLRQPGHPLREALTAPPPPAGAIGQRGAITGRWAGASTRRPSSTPRSACWPPAARPTT
jgi:hypothetical protein